VREFLREQNVELFSTNSPFKCALVERFNRTLKTMMYKYFTANKTKRWYGVLDNMVAAYNQRPNRTIGVPPATVLTEEDDKRVWRRVYYDSKEARTRLADMRPANVDNIANTGDRVRISLTKGHFDKGYVPNWGRQQLVVKECYLQHAVAVRVQYLSSMTHKAKTLKANTILRRCSVCQTVSKTYLK
jgi:hypothetical protein